MTIPSYAYTGEQDERSKVISRAYLAATDDAQWSSKELKQLIRDLLRVTGL